MIGSLPWQIRLWCWFAGFARISCVMEAHVKSTVVYWLMAGRIIWHRWPFWMTICSVVEQYNRDLAEWEYQVSRKPTAAANEKRRPPEKQIVLKHLREIQERNKQKPPQRQRKKSIDRDSR